jgi:ribosome-binding ATPase YchF (GTP1/OBG family)
MSYKPITTIPNQEQETWLRDNYRMYNRYHLAKHLNISAKELTAWFRHLGMAKRDAKVIVLTDEQKQFIRDNYKEMKHEEIASKLELAVMSVQKFCGRNGLRKLKRCKERFPRLPKLVSTVEVEKKPPRPRADHTNMSREQRIEFWINYPI